MAMPSGMLTQMVLAPVLPLCISKVLEARPTSLQHACIALAVDSFCSRLAGSKQSFQITNCKSSGCQASSTRWNSLANAQSKSGEMCLHPFIISP